MFEIIPNPTSFSLVLSSALPLVLPTDSPHVGASPIGITFKLHNISRSLYMYYDQYGDSYSTSNTSGKAHQFEYNYKTREFKAIQGKRKGYYLQQGADRQSSRLLL